jgi:hypothetical protein
VSEERATRPYTPADDAIIRQRAGNTSWSAIGALLGRSADGVSKRAAILGLVNTGAGDAVAYEVATRAATIRLGEKIREVAARRGVPLPVATYREGARA